MGDPRVGDLPRPAQVDLVDDCSRFGQRVGSFARRAFDLSIDGVVAEVDVECEPEPFGRRVERAAELKRLATSDMMSRSSGP